MPQTREELSDFLNPIPELELAAKRYLEAAQKLRYADRDLADTEAALEQCRRNVTAARDAAEEAEANLHHQTTR